MQANLDTNRNLPRAAGLAYLLMILTSGIAYGVWRSMTAGTAVEILGRVQSSQSLFAVMVVMGAMGFVFWMINGFLLYRVFARHSPIAAGLMLSFVGAGSVLALAGIAHQVDALSLIRGAEGLPALNEEAIHLQTLLALRAYDHMFWVSAIFSGLWLVPLGWLVFRCGFIPRTLGVMLMLGSLLYLATLPGMVADPLFHNSLLARTLGIVSGIPSLVGEFGTCLWLLVANGRSLRPVVSAGTLAPSAAGRSV